MVSTAGKHTKPNQVFGHTCSMFFSNKMSVFVSLCATELYMFLAGAVVWRAGVGGSGGGLFLKCWWAYWKCVRQERNAGRGCVGVRLVCVCVCV